MVNTKVTSRAVNQARVPMPADALDLNARRGTSGITVTPYTTLRLLNCRRRRAGALASLGLAGPRRSPAVTCKNWYAQGRLVCPCYFLAQLFFFIHGVLNKVYL